MYSNRHQNNVILACSASLTYSNTRNRINICLWQCSTHKSVTNSQSKLFFTSSRCQIKTKKKSVQITKCNTIYGFARFFAAVYLNYDFMYDVSRVTTKRQKRFGCGSIVLKSENWVWQRNSNGCRWRYRSNLILSTFIFFLVIYFRAVCFCVNKSN